MNRPLSKREQILAAIVGTIVLIGASLMLGSSYLNKRAALEAKITSEQRQLRSMRELLEQRSFWETREMWIRTAQPKLDNMDTAGVHLLDYVQKLAKKHSVLVDHMDIRSPERRPDCISVALEIETKSPWAPLVSFLAELQSPELFIALENVNLKVDGADATQMRGHLKIALWYAPN
jgi:hypothetical protein